MYTVITKREINAPADKVWAALADFGGIFRFHPFVEKSEITSRQKEGQGTERQCTLYSGQTIDERLVNQVDGERIEIEIIGGDMPLKKAIAQFDLRALAPNRTEVRMVMRFQPKFGLLGAIMAPVMLKPMFKHMLGKMLSGLNTHLETGSVIGKGGQPIAA